MKTSRFAIKTENSTSAKCNNKNTKNILQHFFFPVLMHAWHHKHHKFGYCNLFDLCMKIEQTSSTFGAIKSQDQCWPKKRKKKKEKESRPMSIIYMQSINIWNSNRPHIFCIQNNRAPFTPIVIILEFQNNQKVDRNMKQHSYIMSYSSKPTSINHLASKLFIVWPSFPLNAFTKKLIAISGPINATNWNSFQYVHWI